MNKLQYKYSLDFRSFFNNFPLFAKIKNKFSFYTVFCSFRINFLPLCFSLKFLSFYIFIYIINVFIYFGNFWNLIEELIMMETV